MPKKPVNAVKECPLVLLMWGSTKIKAREEDPPTKPAAADAGFLWPLLIADLTPDYLVDPLHSHSAVNIFPFLLLTFILQDNC